jgi:hypothetical protein
LKGQISLFIRLILGTAGRVVIFFLAASASFILLYLAFQFFNEFLVRFLPFLPGKIFLFFVFSVFLLYLLFIIPLFKLSLCQAANKPKTPGGNSRRFFAPIFLIYPIKPITIISVALAFEIFQLIYPEYTRPSDYRGHNREICDFLKDCKSPEKYLKTSENKPAI